MDKREAAESQIPEDSPYWKESEDVKRHWRQADEVIAKPPVRLIKWLDSQGIDHIPHRTKRKNSIWKSLKSRNLHEVGSRWRVEAGREMKSWGLKSITPRVAQELAWRLVEIKVTELEPMAEQSRDMVEPDQEEVEEKLEGMEFLPPWMRWVVMHPGLLLDPEVVQTDPVLKKRIDKYEKAFPCPHQAARNQFSLYRGDKKALDSLFKEIARLHQTFVKQSDSTKADGGGERSVESQSILTLASLLGE